MYVSLIAQNPFYMKETRYSTLSYSPHQFHYTSSSSSPTNNREVFRKLFGPPKSKSTFVKVSDTLLLRLIKQSNLINSEFWQPLYNGSIAGPSITSVLWKPLHSILGTFLRSLRVYTIERFHCIVVWYLEIVMFKVLSCFLVY